MRRLTVGAALIAAGLAGVVLPSVELPTVDFTAVAAYDACVAAALDEGSPAGDLAYETLTEAGPAALAAVDGIDVYEDGSARVRCATVMWDMPEAEATDVVLRWDGTYDGPVTGFSRVAPMLLV